MPKIELKKKYRKKKHLFLVLISALFLASLLGAIKYFYFSPPEIVPIESSAYFEWGECDFEKPILSIIYCGAFHTSTDKTSLKTQHKLPVVLIRPFTFFRKQSPIIYFSGGPGGSNYLDSAGIKNWLKWLKENKWERDFFIYEQRGIGTSIPRYSCPDLIKKHKKYVSLGHSIDQELELFNSLLQKCYKTLVDEGADLHNLNTFKNAEDALGIMSSLDYEQWNIYGVSYGTKLAIEVLRQDSNRINSVVLDSVYPKHVISLKEWPKLLFQNMSKIINACEKEDECNKKYENLHLIYDMLIEKLKNEPDKFLIKDYHTDKYIDFILTDWRLLDVLFDTSYVHRDTKVIPKMLVEYFDGNTGLIKEAIENAMYSYWDESFSDPVFISVECHDNISITEIEYNNSVSAYPEISEYVRDLWKYDACHYWNSGKPNKEFYNEYEPSVPVLILSTTFDPITPVEWATSLQEIWPSSYLIKMKGSGHGVVDNYLCGAWVTLDFFDNPSKKPTSECLKKSDYNSMVFE